MNSDENFRTPGPIVDAMATKKTTKQSEAPPAEKAGSRMGRPLEMRGPLGELAEAVGGRKKLAEEVGVDERSVARWAIGQVVPPQPTRKLLAALARLHDLEPPYGVGAECPRPAWLDEAEEDD